MNISFVFECNPTLPVLFGTIRMALVEMKVCDEQWNKNGCNLKWNIRTIQTLQLCTKHNSNATFHGNTFNFQSIVAFDIKQTIYYFLFHHKAVWMLSGHFTTFQIQYYRVFFFLCDLHRSLECKLFGTFLGFQQLQNLLS